MRTFVKRAITREQHGSRNERQTQFRGQGIHPEPNGKTDRNDQRQQASQQRFGLFERAPPKFGPRFPERRFHTDEANRSALCR
jgi:hypothetical protein